MALSFAGQMEVIARSAGKSAEQMERKRVVTEEWKSSSVRKSQKQRWLVRTPGYMCSEEEHRWANLYVGLSPEIAIRAWKTNAVGTQE